MSRPNNNSWSDDDDDDDFNAVQDDVNDWDDDFYTDDSEKAFMSTTMKKTPPKRKTRSPLLSPPEEKQTETKKQKVNVNVNANANANANFQQQRQFDILKKHMHTNIPGSTHINSNDNDNDNDNANDNNDNNNTLNENETNLIKLLRKTYKTFEDLKHALENVPFQKNKEHTKMLSTLFKLKLKWNSGNITTQGSFLYDLMMQCRTNLLMKRTVLHIVNGYTSEQCSVHEGWETMIGEEWEQNPYIIMYQNFHNNDNIAISSSSSSSSSNIVHWKPQLCRRDCGAGGDCLFKTIAWAINDYFGETITSKDIRRYAAAQVNDDNYFLIQHVFLSQYGKSIKKYKNKEFMNKEEVKKLIQTNGWSYQGDDTVLDLLSQSNETKLHNVGYLILTEQGGFHNLISDSNNVLHPYYILIYHLHIGTVGHFQLAGWLDTQGCVKSIFKPEEIPVPLLLQLKDSIPNHPLKQVLL